MNEAKSFLRQQVQIISNNKTLDIQLSFQDVMKDLTCTKEEIARRFRIIIQQKQGQLRKQIDHINAQNLKIMHDKSLYFQEVNKTSRSLTEQIRSKVVQIAKLEENLSRQKINNLQLEESLKDRQKKHNEFQLWALNQHKRLEVVQSEYKKLLHEINEQKDRKNELQRRVDSMKNQTINWGDRIQYLLQNREMGLKNDYDEQINKLKDILFFYENNYRIIKQQMVKQKAKFEQEKQIYVYTIKNIQTKYELQSLPILHHKQVQTEQIRTKMIDAEVQIQVQCDSCRKINDVVRHLTKFNACSQTQRDQRQYSEKTAQTDFKFMTTQQQRKIMHDVRQLISISQKQKLSLATKIRQLEKIVLNQPSRMGDLMKILKLQNIIEQKDRTIDGLKNQNSSMRSLNLILHNQMQSLKLQLTQRIDVRVESLQFQMKKDTRRFFTQIPQIQTSNFFPKDSNQSKNIINQNRFSKTVDTSAYKMQFSNKMVRAATSNSMNMKPKTAKSVMMKRTQNSQDPQTYRWQKFQKKLKNPQFFSSSPSVNLVRRQKYKKFSSLRKKKHHNKEIQANFTVAF